MTPLSALLQRASKQRLRNEGVAETVAQSSHQAEGGAIIELRRSRIHHRVLIGVGTLSFLAPLNAQLPWQVAGFIWTWTLVCLFHHHRTQSTPQALRDTENGWQLVVCARVVLVHYKSTPWCNAHLILMTFADDAGKTHRVSIWRDAVTESSFSWLAARVTLTRPDKKVKTVSTSYSTNFHHTR